MCRVHVKPYTLTHSLTHSVMAERPRNLADFKVVGHLESKF